MKYNLTEKGKKLFPNLKEPITEGEYTEKKIADLLASGLIEEEHA